MTNYHSTESKFYLIFFLCIYSYFTSVGINYIYADNNSHLSIYKEGWIDLNKNGVMDIYENPKAPIDKRVEDLLSQMTLEEKTCQLVTLYGYKRVLKDSLPTTEWKNKIWKDGIGAIDEHLNGFIQWGREVVYSPLFWPASNHAKAINEVQRFFIEETRLGIPADMTNEGIRGVEAYKATCFPAPIGLGHTWDKELIKKVGYITGREARLLGYTNVYAPILDVGRDQRWGRYEEIYGESPYLVAELGIAMALGMQTNYQVASTAKHYLAYSNNKGAREGMARVDPQMPLREVENIHVWPFREVIARADILGVMCSYNDYDGFPIQSSHYWLYERLRNEMGFRGYVVSDSGSVEYLFRKHRTAESETDAVRQSIEAGLNVRCNFSAPETYVLPLRELYKKNQISQKLIDERVRDVLRVKFLVGLFDSPYQLDFKAADEEVNGKANNEVSLTAAKESIVLLKNNNNLLPINFEKLKRVAVIGPNADEKSFALTHYGPLAVDVTSVLDALKNNLKDVCQVSYEKGCELVDKDWPQSELYERELDKQESKAIHDAVKLCKKSDLAIVVLGGGIRTCGENKSRSSLNLPGRQERLLKDLYATGKPIVLVLINGRPLSINWANDHIDSILEAWYPGPHGGQAIYEVLAGIYNPGGKLTVTIPKHVGQIPYNFPNKPAANVDGGLIPGPLGNQSRVNGALYEFGYGLSYTKFEYSDLKVNSKLLTDKDTLVVSFNVKNIGKCAGDEIPQLYIRDKVSSVTTYDKNLRGFERIHLNPGETKRVIMKVRPIDLSLINKDMKRVIETGDFEIMVGAASNDIRLKDIVSVNQSDLKSDSSDSLFPWTFKKEDSFTISLKENCKIDHLEITWENDTVVDFEIQFMTGGGQFLTAYKGHVSKGNISEECHFKLTNASDVRINVINGTGIIKEIKSPFTAKN